MCKECVIVRGLKVPTFLLLFLVITFSLVSAEEKQEKESRVVPELKAYRINPHPPNIDGNLDDAIWNSDNLTYAGVFTQREPDEGQPATESTLVAVVYDDAALYVGFWCYDSEPEKVAAQLVRRDRSAQSDYVTVRLDPFHDHQSGQAFEISAAGVKRDARYYNENNTDLSWDAVWDAAAQIQPWGWSAEFRIPYHCLRFSSKEEHIWGADFVRSINRKNENVRWAYTPTEDGGFVSNFGHLTNIKGIQPARHAELLPYVLSKAETEPKSLGNTDGRDYLGNMGFDLKYALSTNLILDAAVNPDFGQVELDQPVLNLSAYETFFDERRPFFLEGSDLFNTEFNMFYSRRIGRSPFNDVNDANLGYYTDYPDATTILTAAKLTGRLGERTSIAVLTAVTQEESADYARFSNPREDTTWEGSTPILNTSYLDTTFRSGTVEPLANYTVIRIKQDIFSHSSIGAILTSAGQESYHPATTGGVDWRLVTSDNKWGIRGQAIMSRTNSEDVGYGFDITLDKMSGRHIRAAIGTTIKDPNLNINRLGYSSRVDSRSVWGWMQYRTSDDWWIIRNSYNNFNVHSSWNFDGINYSLNGNFNSFIEFINNWSLGYGFTIQGEKYSDLETRGMGLWEWPVRPTYSWWANLNSDQRKKISFSINPGMGSDRGGSWWANYFGIDMRPRSNVELSIGANYHKIEDGLRWVMNDGDSVVFADLDRDQLFMHASASLVFNRNLTFQLSAVALISGLDYQHYRYYRGGQDYSNPVSLYNEDYNFSALNSTMLIRWEYSPGSTLYLVWTRARPQFDSGVNDLDFSRDFDRLFSGGDQNVFLLKASYWMNI